MEQFLAILGDLAAVAAVVIAVILSWESLKRALTKALPWISPPASQAAAVFAVVCLSFMMVKGFESTLNVTEALQKTQGAMGDLVLDLGDRVHAHDIFIRELIASSDPAHIKQVLARAREKVARNTHLSNETRDAMLRILSMYEVGVDD